MNLLTPWTAGIAAMLAIPSLLLLYFLKLRRRPVAISSTLLWKKAIHDLQVNAPFQKLRKNLLLLLQMLAVLLAIAALATPISHWSRDSGSKFVILIDRSASMSTLEAGRSRLELAKEAAKDYMRGLPDGSQVCVIEFAAKARAVCTFTADVSSAGRAIDDIEQTDEPTRMAEAIQLALAHSAPTRVETPTEMATRDPDAMLVLFSDGRISDADDQVLSRGDLKFYKVGESRDNVGIVTLDVQRLYDNPNRLNVFATIENFGPEVLEVPVSLRLNGETTLNAEQVKLGPAVDMLETRPGARDQLASARSIAFEMQHDSGGVIEVIIHRNDELEVDNVARVPIDPPREISILVVTDRPNVSYLLTRALEGMPVGRLDNMTTAEYETSQSPDVKHDFPSLYDLIVFDNHSTAKLPRTAFLFLGGVPEVDEIRLGDPITDENIVTWDETHPLMRFVSFGNVRVRQWNRLELPKYAQPLVEGQRSQVMTFVPYAGRQFVITAFELGETDWWQREEWVVFLVNVTRYFSAGGGGALVHKVQTGETITLPSLRGGEITAKLPGGESEELVTDPVLTTVFARTSTAGLYDFTTADEEYRVGVNLLDPLESNITPVKLLTVGGAEVASQSDASEEVNQPLWPWLLWGMLAMLLIEWWIYNRRVML